jgi:hypothetical protein
MNENIGKYTKTDYLHDSVISLHLCDGLLDFITKGLKIELKKAPNDHEINKVCLSNFRSARPQDTSGR